MIKGREEEYKKILKCINMYLETGIGSSVYVCGVPGSGKTYTLLKLAEEEKIDTVYFNCTLIKKKSQIFSLLLKRLSACKMGTAAKCGLQGLKAHFTKCPKRHIFIIDEVDLLLSKNSAVLYNLFDLPITHSVLLIVIANNLPEKDGKVSSRLGSNRIYFRPYTCEQLVEIFRLEADDPFILACKRIGAVSGDFRKLQNLKELLTKNTYLEVNQKLKEMYSPLHLFFLKSLTPIQKIIIKILLVEKTMSKVKCFEEFRSVLRMQNKKEDLTEEWTSFELVLNTLTAYNIIKFTHHTTIISLVLLKEEIADFI